MLDLKYVAQNFDAVAERLATRGANLDLGSFRALFAERRSLHVSLESLQAKRNAANEEMKRVAKEDPAALERLRGDLRTLSQQIKEDEKQLAVVEDALSALLLTVPNVPDPSVPVGASEADNVVVRTWGEPPRLLTCILPYWPRSCVTYDALPRPERGGGSGRRRERGQTSVWGALPMGTEKARHHTSTVWGPSVG